MPHSFLLGSHADECKVPALYRHCVERLMSGCVHQVFLHLHQKRTTPKKKETFQVINSHVRLGFHHGDSKIRLQFLELQFEGSAPEMLNPKTSPPKPPLLHETPTFRGGRVKYYGIFSGKLLPRRSRFERLGDNDVTWAMEQGALEKKTWYTS